MSAGRHARSRTAATDGLLVGLVATVVYALRGFDGPLDRDLGVFVYGGERVAAGVPSYVGIFNSVGPLADALPGLAIWAGGHVGVDPVRAARLLFLALAVGCCVLLSVLARDVLGSRAAAYLAPAALLTFAEFSQLAANGPREKTAMVFLLLATLLLLGRRRWLAAGVTTALATLTWQPVLLVATTAAAVAVVRAGTGRVRAAVTWVAGGAATTGVFGAWFLAHGALRTAVEGFVVVNVRYTRQPSLVTDFDTLSEAFWTSYHASLLLVPVGLVALAAVVARDVSRTAVVGSAALAATAWTVAVVNGPPDLFVLLPFAALGLAGAVVGLAARVPRGSARALVGSAVVVALAVAALDGVTTRDDTLTKQRADVAGVLGAAPPGATILSINAPGALALAGRTNPTRYQVFDSAMDRYLDDHWPGGLRGYADWIGRTRPTLVAFSAGRDQNWPYRVLRRDYWYAGRGPGWGWYVSRSAGADTLAAVSAAIHRARGA
ncbi:MAG TPA: hypothetical protein VFT70_07840 [Nocardioides sp.]|nr:hypothetical protein [Nocardioides sp.]